MMGEAIYITYRRLIFIVTVSLCTICGAKAQFTAVDSLIREAAKEKTDSARINALTEMARRVANEDTALAMMLWEKTLAWARESPDRLSEAKSYLNIGSWYYDHYRTEQAQRYNTIARKMVEHDTARNARLLLTKIRINAANIFWQQGQVEEALQEYLAVLPLTDELGDNETMALVNTNIAILFSNQKQYAKSDYYFAESIQQYRHLLPASHRKIADIYIMLSMNTLNEDIASLSTGTALLDSALYHLQFTDEQHVVWASYYSARGRYQLAADDLVAAERSFQQGLPIGRRYNDTYSTCDMLLYLSEVYERQGEFTKIAPLLDELLAIGQTNHVGTYQLKALRSLSRIEYRLKRSDEAYRHLSAYVELSDSLQYTELSKTIREIEEKYNLSEAENKLLVLQQENERKDFTLERNRLYIGLLAGIAIPLFISCVLVFLLYRSKQKTLTQQQHIHTIDMERIEQAHRNSLLSALLEGQERERARLARDLHDGLGGILSSIKLDLSRIALAVPKDIAQGKGLNGVVNNLDGAVEELRGIAHSMMPAMLFNYGLVEALREYCEKLKRAGCVVFFQAFHYKNDMEQSRQLLLYRIVQEMVNNCVKHAQSTEILVQLQQTASTIAITVEDDGVGFDLSASHTGAGLANIAMRVDLLHGTLDIQSDAGVGSTFTVECPVTLKDDALPLIRG